MSQYPSPYQQPQYQGQYQPGYMGYDPFEQALAPCQRAGVLMFVLAGLLFLLGLCFGGAFLVIPMNEFMSQPGMQQLPPGVTFEMVRLGVFIFSGAMLILALLYLVLGVFVRRGGKGASITALVFSFLAIAFLGLQIIGGLAQAGQAGGQALLGACFMLIPAGLLLWLIIWLFQAIGATNNYRNLQMQYQAQYYQQQQQAYGQQQQYPYPQQQQQWPGQYPQQPPQQPPPQT